MQTSQSGVTRLGGVQFMLHLQQPLGSQAGVVDISHASHLYYYKCCRWIEFQLISTWLRVPRFPPSSKLIPSLIHLAVVLCSEVIYGSYLGAEGLAGSTAPSVPPRWAAPFAIQSTDCEEGWLAGQTFTYIHSEVSPRDAGVPSLHVHAAIFRLRRGRLPCLPGVPLRVNRPLVNKQIDTDSGQLDWKLCDLIYWLVALIFYHIRRSTLTAPGHLATNE